LAPREDALLELEAQGVLFVPVLLPDFPGQILGKQGFRPWGESGETSQVSESPEFIAAENVRGVLGKTGIVGLSLFLRLFLRLSLGLLLVLLLL